MHGAEPFQRRVDGPSWGEALGVMWGGVHADKQPCRVCGVVVESWGVT